MLFFIISLLFIFGFALGFMFLLITLAKESKKKALKKLFAEQNNDPSKIYIYRRWAYAGLIRKPNIYINEELVADIGARQIIVTDKINDVDDFRCKLKMQVVKVGTEIKHDPEKPTFIMVDVNLFGYFKAYQQYKI